MPELPEVEVVRRGMAPAVTSARVTSVHVYDERSLRRHPGPSEDFVDRLTGRTIRKASRRGKFLWLPLDPGAERAGAAGTVPEALVVHLGMSGQVLLRDPGIQDARTRIRIELEHPSRGREWLNFVDQRIFGSMAIDELVPTADVRGQFVPSHVAHIARDPLDPHFDDRRYFATLAHRNTAIKRALLDQSLISGIGNIYADESLWRARIHYDQPAASLSRPRAKALLDAIRQVLAAALAEGGTSFDSQYVDVNGASGYFTPWLNVYGQKGEPCPRCGRPVVREKFMNRGSHFCPFCQRVRKPRSPAI